MDDLTGTAGERARQLERLEADGALDPDWLRRQLRNALENLAAAEKIIEVEAEGHEDF
jgi:hypothetical protein